MPTVKSIAIRPLPFEVLPPIHEVTISDEHNKNTTLKISGVELAKILCLEKLGKLSITGPTFFSGYFTITNLEDHITLQMHHTQVTQLFNQNYILPADKKEEQATAKPSMK